MKKQLITLVLTLSLVLCGCGTDQDISPDSNSPASTNSDADSGLSSGESDIPSGSGNSDVTDAASTIGIDQDSAALTPNSLAPKAMDVNPYMSPGESNVHNDSYNSDVTDAVLPIGIDAEVTAAVEMLNPNAAPAIFYDAYGNAISPLLGGVAIRDLNADTVTTQGAFVPAQHDGGGYYMQPSYAFVDADNHIVAPTSHNHVLMLRTTDETGAVLPVFEKVLDIDIKMLAEQALGKTIDQNLLSVTFDYDGNLWFVTGGFRIYPDRGQTGMMGYITRTAIDEILAGGSPDLTEAFHVVETEPGEGAENGIASCADGTVILTNQACYLLRANNGVETVWRTPYGSNGANDSQEGADTTGGGLAWGGGSSPTLTRDLVLFTDNLDPVNVIALDMKTGEEIASHPVLDELPENMPVSVENSIIGYDNGEGTVSVIVCNWFGAGNAGLADPDSDSSVQSYANIYDANWMSQGNIMVMPGMERVDIVKTAAGYEVQSVWVRNDIRDTSMFRLSTATGYLYGYVQDMDTGMWQYIMLDFGTGETAYTLDVSSKPGYNNLAVGMYGGSQGNVLYCPTGYLEVLRMQDRFAYLPEMPYREVDLDLTSRSVVTEEDLAAQEISGTPATWLHSVTVNNVHPNTTIALKVNGLTGDAEALALYVRDADGRFVRVADELWSLNAEGKLSADVVYEIHVTVADDGVYDANENPKTITLSAMLVAG